MYIYVGFHAGGHLLLRVVELAVAQVRSSRECSTCLTSIRQWGGELRERLALLRLNPANGSDSGKHSLDIL